MLPKKELENQYFVNYIGRSIHTAPNSINVTEYIINYHCAQPTAAPNLYFLAYEID
jgi:hypothetical protein